MSKIIVRNSCIMITDYNLGDCVELERNFMVYDPTYHTYNILGMYYSASTSTLYIPRGVDIWKIKKYLHEKDHIVDDPDPFEETGKINIKYKPRDEEQEEALKFMVGLDPYKENLYLPQLSVNLNTGKGKTYCSIAAISFMRIKSIIITGSNSLLSQWKDNIKEYTDLEDKDIMFISGSQMMNMILHEKSKVAKEAKIFLCTHATIRSFCETYGWTKLKDIFIALGIGMKFFDEAHTNFDNMLMIDFFTNCLKTFYVTATPGRSSWAEDRIYKLSIKNVPGIDLFNIEQDPHTDYIAIKYNSKPSPIDIQLCHNYKYGLDRNKYIKYLLNNDNFWLVMRIVMDMYIRCKGRGLFYIGTNEGVLKMYKWICTNYPQLIGQVGIYTSIVSNDLKLQMKQKKLILSTTKSAGLGEHIEGLKMTVVVAEPFKSKILTRQTLGRTRDKDTIYIELVDLGFKYTRNYYYYKLPILNKYALSVSDTTIDSYELIQRANKLIEKQEKKNAMCPIYFVYNGEFDKNNQEEDNYENEEE